MNNSNKELPLSRKAALWVIKGYQLCISPMLSPCCRFYPSCSSYAVEAISRFGVLRGSYLTILRLARCQPLCKGGVDLVPESFEWLPKGTVDEVSKAGSS